MPMYIISRTLQRTDCKSVSDLIRMTPEQITTDIKSIRVLDECMINGKIPNILPLDLLISKILEDEQPVYLYCPTPTHPQNKLIPELTKSLKEKNIQVVNLC